MTSDLKTRVVLFLLVWFSCAWFGSWELNPNQATRMYAAISLIEDHDATIDEYADATIGRAHGMTLRPADRGAVINGHFLRGDLRTIGSEYWGWSPWTGFAVWVVVAVSTIAWLVIRARKGTLT